MRVSRNGEPRHLASRVTDFSQEDYFDHPMYAIANPRVCDDPSCGAIVCGDEPCVVCEMRSSLDGFQESKVVNAADIDAQSAPSPTSSVSSEALAPVILSSEAPVTSISTTPSVQGSGDYLVRNHIISMSTGPDGVLWIVFPYSKNEEVKYHSIRCDVHTVPPSELRDDIKTIAAAVIS
jgi:hypothetical protein